MIFASNMLCLGLILTFVETVFGVRLPVDLPILNMFVSYVGLQATSLSPGLVAISYAVVGMLTGGLVAFVYMFIDNAKPLMRIKKALLLDKLDLRIDVWLDKYSFWMDQTKYPWLIAPQVLLLVLCLIVIGGAALL